MVEKIHIIVSLFSAIIVTIASLIQKNTIGLMCYRLIFTIVFFYIFGIIIETQLKKMLDDDLYDGLEVYNTNTEQEETPEDEQ